MQFEEAWTGAGAECVYNVGGFFVMIRVAWMCMLLPLGPLLGADGPTLSTAEIMARVAANQDRAEQLRSEYVYQQHIHVAARRTNGKLAREETADYQVTPMPNGQNKELKGITGRYWHKGEYLDFQGEPVPEADSLDGELVHSFRDDLSNDNSKDGLGADLFPLTAKEQKEYRYELAGEDMVQGRAVYRIRFTPADRNDISWAGEALIDKDEFQPVTVFTRLSRKIPFWVRTMLGTNLPGIGFNVQYRRFNDGVWLPVSFGTEFRLHVLFLINREISVSLENSGFQRARSESKILGYEAVP